MADIFNQINSIFALVSAILVAHNYLYLIVGVFFRSKKYPETDIQKKYGILIAARNEEKVIGQLIDSLNQQDYPKELFKVFVVADNCTDNTAKISREKGAICYERFDKERARKGYALEFLVDHIRKDFGIESLDGYIVFDADNLVEQTFIHEINKAFVYENGGIITGYRNTKNFESNIISSGYAFHFYRSSMVLHRPRQKLGIGTHLAGTGYVVDSKLLMDGWHYHTLTEDTEFTIVHSALGNKIKYCEAAKFYDEQPTNLVVSIRQRVRWTRGRLSVFLSSGWKLFIGIFKHRSFTNYDMFFYLFPWSIITYVGFVLQTIALLIGSLIYQVPFDYNVLLNVIYGYIIAVYVLYVLYGILISIRERKQIKAPYYKILLYSLFYPLFELIHFIVTPIAILKPKIEWTPIVHNIQKDISDLVDQDV